MPRGLQENLAFRRRMWKAGYESSEKAAMLRKMCAVDPLFYVNTFCWTHNPMWFPDHPERPFITWEFQEPVIEDLVRSIGRHDISIVKSRETGASWTLLYVQQWRWTFFKSQTFLLVSRNEAYVDTPKNLDALMPKLDFALERLPGWMCPAYERYMLRLFNKNTESLISGTSTTGEIGRGGRRTGIALDEFAFFDRSDSYRALAATQGTSRCRWFVSTPNGVGNAFYDVAHSPTIRRVDFGWEQVPFKRAGLYTSENGKLKLLDEGFRYPDDYRFILDGKMRSMWYDEEERRTPIASIMAQEHDRDFLGSGKPFFKPDELKKIEAMHVINPFYSGSMEKVGGKFTFSRETGGKKLKLWITLDAYGRPPARGHSYVIGVDVSAGSGASNSCAEVIDEATGELVAEYADPYADPIDLAELCNMLGRFFVDDNGTPAYLIWEANGQVGIAFGKRIKALGYPNLHVHIDESKIGQPRSRKEGLYVSGKQQDAMLYEFARAMATGEFVNRSREAVYECREYAYLDGGGIGHVRSISVDDPSGARANHGDRVRGQAIGWYAATIRGGRKAREEEQVPRHCLANRMKIIKAEEYRRLRELEGWLVA